MMRRFLLAAGLACLLVGGPAILLGADPEPAQNVRIVGSAGVILQQVVSVGTSATKLPTTPLTGRKNLVVMSLCSTDVYLGKSTVTTTGSTRGPKLSPGMSFSSDSGPTIDVYGIVASGTCDVAVWERS